MYRNVSISFYTATEVHELYRFIHTQNNLKLHFTYNNFTEVAAFACSTVQSAVQQAGNFSCSHNLPRYLIVLHKISVTALLLSVSSPSHADSASSHCQTPSRLSLGLLHKRVCGAIKSGASEAKHFLRSRLWRTIRSFISSF
jgi:hypothetical protein